MNISTYKKRFFRISIAFFFVFAGKMAFSGDGGVVETYKNATAPFDDEKYVDPVLSFPENIVQVTENNQGGVFWTIPRKDKIQRFACNQCHNNQEVNIPKAAEMAHGDINLIHGGQDKPLQCFTCHNKDERNLLVTEKGETVDMDHSYQLCGQCHFRQKKDWIGGAHGKRVSHWAGKRVVQNCTSCHNPHSPRFEKQWPATYSTPLD
jgi:formate-dependent nitrite reductase cytochrome c552 subunit